MFNRIMDNSKVLRATGVSQGSFSSLKDGLESELTRFSKKPKFSHINEDLDAQIDELVESSILRVAKKMKPRTRLRRLKEATRIRTRVIEIKNRVQLRARAKRLTYSTGNRKKDGLIVTLTGSSNYGNIIQRYALKEYLRLKGYHFDVVKSRFDKGSTSSVHRKTEEFIDRYIGGDYFDEDKVQGYRNYIVGSDQVFRNWYGEDWYEFSVFFLGFIRSRSASRISYAASFGVDSLDEARIIDSNRSGVSRLLSKFNAISVREESAVKLVDMLVGRDHSVSVVLDPTMLLLSEDYSELIELSEAKNLKRHRLFCYILDKDRFKMDIINKVSPLYGEDCLVVNPNPDDDYISVEAWLKGFRDADFVITDSFHGMVFSIINNKDFIAVGNRERGLARFTNIFNTLGIDTDRLVEDGAKEVYIEALSPIEWDSVNSKLDELRKKSEEWLLGNIK